MSLALATSAVVSTAVVGNRILALLVGLWLHVPSAWLLVVLILCDVIQIPFYFWLYRNGARGIRRLPGVFRRWMEYDWRATTAFGRWAMSVRGWGVMLVAAWPAFGGGIWTATLLAHNLRMSWRAGTAWMMAGSVLSYVALWSMGQGTLLLLRRWVL